MGSGLTIPGLGRLRKEDLEVKFSLDYIARACLKHKIKTWENVLEVIVFHLREQ
jgi:hypothetical protein